MGHFGLKRRVASLRRAGIADVEAQSERVLHIRQNYTHEYK